MGPTASFPSATVSARSARTATARHRHILTSLTREPVRTKRARFGHEKGTVRARSLSSPKPQPPQTPPFTTAEDYYFRSLPLHVTRVQFSPYSGPTKRTQILNPKSATRNAAPGPIRDLVFLNFLLYPLPNPSGNSYFRALRAASEIRARMPLRAHCFTKRTQPGIPNQKRLPALRVSVVQSLLTGFTERTHRAQGYPPSSILPLRTHRRPCGPTPLPNHETKPPHAFPHLRPSAFIRGFIS